MTIVPNSDIILLKTPFEMDERNQLTFVSKTAQYNYFHSLPKLEYDKCTYQRKDGVIRYTTEKNGLTYEDLIQYNYCMYQNEAYDNKWFYAYIENIEYKNDGMSEVKIKTDVFQTWQFDIVYKRSFVEREHVNNDTIGANLIEENLNLGDYTSCKNCEKILEDNTDFYVCMGVTELPDESVPSNVKIRNYNGIFGGLYYLAFTSFNNCEKAIKIYDHFGKADAINSIFMIPKNLGCVTDGTTVTWQVPNFSTTNVIYLEPADYADTVGTLNCEIPSKIGKSYIPKNNKLFTFPFSFMNVTNNSGETVEFRYEDFDRDETTGKILPSFWIDASLCPGMSMKAIPLFYKNINYNYNFGVTLGKLPVCSWNSDVYTNWLTQNGVNNVVRGVMTGYNIIGNIANSSQAGSVGGLSGIFGLMQEYREARIEPNQAKGNVGNGDINFSEELDGGLTVYYMSIKDEVARTIDDFFSMFGYKVNRVKTPNITGRSNWNYVKTVDINITGDFPQADLQEIKDMFNAGCTFWHNPSTFLDYSQSNNIV